MRVNREGFMRALVAKLSRLPEEERLSAIAYYEEYFDEAGPDKEAEVIKELGNPADIAKQIMAEFVVKEAEVGPMKPKQSFQTVWIIIAALFAGPIALPLAIAVASLVFAGLVTIGALIFSGVVTAVAIVGSAIISGIAGITMLFVHPATGIVMIGLALFLLGVGILVGMLMYVVIGKGLPAMTKVFVNLFSRVKGDTRVC